MAYKNYTLAWSKLAYKHASKLPKKDKLRVIEKIENVICDFSSLDIKKIKGNTDLYRIRSGDYRIVYKALKIKKIIFIAAIVHRKEVYRMTSIFARLLPTDIN